MNRRKICCFVMALILGTGIMGANKTTAYAEDGWPQQPEMIGEAAVVMEASTGTVLFEKNPHEQLYPASITKIMTTLLAVENCSLDEEVEFSYESVHNIDRDSTHIFRDVGEIMTMEQCLYAVMLGSANDCAYAVGEHTGKGYENFIAMMNQKAEELGCTDTHFNNPHGLSDPEHYTSAYDMALISKAALENETFRTITAAKRYTIPKTNKHPNDETPLVNHHKMLTNYNGDTAYLYDGCIGGKTGYTDLARNTLVTFAERDNMTLICVVMKENGTSQYTDSKLLLDYCFDNFKVWNISENISEYEVSGTADTEIFGVISSFADIDRDSYIVLPQTAVFSDATSEMVEVPDSADTVARMEFRYNGHPVGSAGIKTTGAIVDSYRFHGPSEEALEKVEAHNRKIRVILIVIGSVIGLALLALLIYYLSNHFYILRHKILSRRRQKSKYKEIKAGKHTKWRRRRF